MIRLDWGDKMRLLQVDDNVETKNGSAGRVFINADLVNVMEVTHNDTKTKWRVVFTMMDGPVVKSRKFDDEKALEKWLTKNFTLTQY